MRQEIVEKEILTRPVIVLRFEASSEESLQRIREEVEPLLTIG
jgi:hypothetical protein